MNDHPDSFHSDEKNNMTLEVTKNDLNRHIFECQERKYEWSEFSELVESINSEDQFKQYSGLIGIRKLLSDDKAAFDDGRIQNAIDAGLICNLVAFLKKDDEPQLQSEAIWTLCTITARSSSDQVEEIVDQGAVPLLVRLLKPCDTRLVADVVMTIGNLAADSSHRDILLDHDVLHPLIDMLNQALVKKDIALITQGTRALSNVCRAKPRPAYERVADTTPVFCAVVQEVTDSGILLDALWALAYLSDDEYKVRRLLEADIVPPLIRHLSCSNDSVITSAFRILANIIAGSDDQADVVLKGPLSRNYVKKLFGFLKNRSDKKAIQREICWTISNMTCRSSYFIDLVLGNPEHIEQLVNIALYDVIDVKKEAAWALSNATVNANREQMISMTRNGVFDCLCKLIRQSYVINLTLLVLTGLQNFLAFGASKFRKEATNNKYLIKLKQKGTVKKIKTLRESQDSEVSEVTVEIWKKHLKVQLLRKKLRLKKAIICFKNERHCLFGVFQNKKKRLSV